MLKLIHIWGSYLFLLSFLIACGLSILSLVRKQPGLERLSAWSFVISFTLLAVSYACGFGPASALTGGPIQVVKLAGRHHDMAKFVFTGMLLAAASSVTVLAKYRKQRFPSWLLPNLLFLSLMIATFSIRSMVYIWRMDAERTTQGTRGEGRGAREETESSKEKPVTKEKSGN
ncbi:MAG TPA: hypothetical protein V6D23_02320 [Candidatus Obscuribacterales bacterium]